MRPTYKSVGDEPAFVNQDHGDLHAHPGMTYRQWLIGQAVAGLSAHVSWTGANRYIADQAARTADAVIERLDEEAAQEKP